MINLKCYRCSQPLKLDEQRDCEAAGTFESDGKTHKYKLDCDPVPCGWDIKSKAEAERIAARLTKESGGLFIATDAGEWTSPRYRVVLAPMVGDEVSYAFNGDYYPCGKIAKVSPTLKKIETDSGKVFYRRGESGSWIMKGGTWSMVKGHISRYNREF